jgi:hypothetical protein
MQRITDTTAAAALPAPPALTGPVGFFTGGAPGVIPATRVRYWWLNMFQEEMMSLLTAAGIAPDTTGTNFTQVLQAIRALSGFQNVQVFSASGTFTVPAPTVEVEMWGGGPGSGACSGLTNNAGSSGAGAGYARKLITGLTVGATVAVTVGFNGVGGIGGGAAPTAGGTTSFGTYVSATGGGAGVNGTGAGPAAGNPTPGTGVGGDVNLTGGNGGNQWLSGSTTLVAWPGGCAPMMPTNQPVDGDNAGIVASNYGCAGRPAVTITGLSLNGGAGKAGLVIARW